MQRTTHTLVIVSLLLLTACPSTDNNVGTVLRDGGGTGGRFQTGGTVASQGGTFGGGGSGGGQASEVANSVSPPTDQASCAKATNVPECLPGIAEATVASTAGGPLLSKVEVTSGPCRPADCSSGCASLTIEAPTATAGATCDLQVTATDGRSQAVHLSAIANPTPNYACCGNGAPPNSGGMWVSLTPTVFSPNSITVVFDAGDASVLPTSNLGAPCDTLTNASPAQGVFNSAAPECSSSLCLKPVVQAGAGNVDTGPFCTDFCTTDDDCSGGRNRNPSDPNDKTCTSGYTCGIAFVKGAICCRKLCVCKDFTGGVSLPTPIACQGSNAQACNL